MTSRKAIEIAIKHLKTKQNDAEAIEAITALTLLQSRSFIISWTDESIIAALDDWCLKNGKAPRTTNLREPGMPGASIIQSHFGITAKAFLNQRYAEKIASEQKKNKYGFTSKEDWINCFKEQFEKNCRKDEFCCKTYNILKDKDTPLWATIAYHCGVSKWCELMELAEVKYPFKIETASTPLSVAIHSPYLDRLEAIIERRERLEREILDRLAPRWSDT